MNLEVDSSITTEGTNAFMMSLRKTTIYLISVGVKKVQHISI
jgi:hypothetical protein